VQLRTKPISFLSQRFLRSLRGYSSQGYNTSSSINSLLCLMVVCSFLQRNIFYTEINVITTRILSPRLLLFKETQALYYSVFQIIQTHSHIGVFNNRSITCNNTPGMRILTHCGRVKQICVFNTVKLGTSASSP